MATDEDPVSPEVTCSPASGGTFLTGETTVYCSATDAPGNTATGSFKVNVVYSFTGFFSPVDNPDVAINKAKAGSAIPVKFSLSGDHGLDIFAEAYPKAQRIDCDTSASTDTLEDTLGAGSTGLSYDPTTDQYTYVWKTDKKWANICRQIVIKLKDGSEHKATFKFTK